MSKTNQYSFIVKYKVWTHLEVIKLTEFGGTFFRLSGRSIKIDTIAK